MDDNIDVHWSPYGAGNMIQQENRATEVYSTDDKVSLNQAYGLVSDG